MTKDLERDLGRFATTTISDRIEASALLFHPDETGTRTFLRKLLEQATFGTRESGTSGRPDGDGTDAE